MHDRHHSDHGSAADAVWLHITSGRGPVECQLAVARLLPVLMQAAAARGLTATVLEAVAGQEKATLASALLAVGGADAVSFAASWCGTVQWTCPSPFRPGHKRKNWFVGVDVLSVPAAGDAALDPRDVTFEAMRAGGAGGQHVNKTESAVRATHRPSGLVATAREERSQHQNRRLALARLAALLRQGSDQAAAQAERDRWEQHDALERGKPVRVFVGEDWRERASGRH